MLLARYCRQSTGFCIFMVISQFLICASAGAASASDETAIREQAQKYSSAFAAAEIDKLSSMWDENAVFVDQFGNSYKGKAAIENQYKEFFSKNGKQPIEISVKSVDFPADDIAIEEGTCRLSSSDSITKYIATHAKRNGKWLMEAVTESAYRAKSNGEYLKPLGWLPGEWNVEGHPNLKVKFDWVNENILSCKADAVSSEGSHESHNEFIYWNPEMGCINSWQFDSHGGVARKYWQKSASGWIVHAVSIQADGMKARADYIITKSAGSDSFTWQSCRRNLNGFDLPDTQKIKFQKVKS